MSEINVNTRTTISPNEVVFFEADENYTRIYYQDRMDIVPVTLKRVEKQLGAFSFFRIHKSYLVNLNYILDKTEKYEVEMTNNRSLTISRRKVGEFRRALKKSNIKFY